MGIDKSQIYRVEEIIAKLKFQLSDAGEEFDTDMADLKEPTTPNREAYIGFMEHRTRMLQFYAEQTNIKLKAIIESLKEPKGV